MRTTRTGSMIVLVMGAAMVLTTCGGSGRASSSTSNGGAAIGAGNKMALISRQGPGTLDYTMSLQTALLNWVPSDVVKPLLTMDNKGEIGSGLVDVEVNDAHAEYTFTFRGNKLSDGSSITAKDVVLSLTKMEESPTVNRVGAFAKVAPIGAVGKERVKVVLERPSQAFIRGMASVPGLIQPEAAFGQIATAPTGSGSYAITEYVQNSRVVLKMNPSYSGKKPAIEEVEIRIISDDAVAFNAPKSGETDGMPLIQDDTWEQLKNQKFNETITLLQSPTTGGKQYFILSTDGANTRSPEVRRVFARTTDREAFVVTVNADWAMTPICDYGFETDLWVEKANPDTCPAPEDPVTAVTLADKLGLGSTPNRFAFLSDVPNLSLPADVLIEQFKAVGIAVDCEVIGLVRYSQTIFQGRSPRFEVTNMSDPAGITQFACPDSQSAGWITYCSSELSDPTVQADAARDTAEYDELLSQANEILKKDMVIAPLTCTCGIGLTKPNLKSAGVPLVVSQGIPVYEVSW